MATTGELRAIIQALDLVDIGDAASYLGEEALVEEESTAIIMTTVDTQCISVLATDRGHLAICDCSSCEVTHI